MKQKEKIMVDPAGLDWIKKFRRFLNINQIAIENNIHVALLNKEILGKKPLSTKHYKKLNDFVKEMKK